MEGIIRMHPSDKMEMESLLHRRNLPRRAPALLWNPGMAQNQGSYQKPKSVPSISKAERQGPRHRSLGFRVRKVPRNPYRGLYDRLSVAPPPDPRYAAPTVCSELIHINDATAFACGRALVAIMENYQNEDCTIRV